MIDDEAVVERYHDAVARIERGGFSPRPDARGCPGRRFTVVCEA